MELSISSIPKIENITITITIPLGTPTTLIETLKFSKAEEFFAKKRDEAGSHSAKVEFDRARALMKYASCHPVKMLEMKQVRYNLKFILNFKSFNDLVRFQKHLIEDVNGSIME